MKINKPAQQKAIGPSAPAFAPQAPFLISKKKESFATWLPLWLCAAFLLFGNLGVQAVNGSESRWLVIAREMFFTGDYLHPTINFEPYFDKPLLTYWFTVFCSLFNGRVVTELTARIPSALAALAALAAVISIAKRLWDTRTALVAGWIFITFYSFAFWGRLAEADMANEAFSTAAVAWYLAYRGKKSFIGYLVFFLICFIGAHAKGLATIAVPILVVLVDQILNKTIKVHCNWKAFLALAIGVGVYLIPFELSRMIAPAISPATQTVIDGDGTVKTSGIALALRENIIRYFDPFDHKEPFYSYFIHVPRLTLPWSPILILAVINAILLRKTLSKEEKWLCWSMIAIFLFFTISGSKRHYYILPLIPYCAIFCAIFLNRESTVRWIEKIKQILLKLYWILPIAGLALMLLTGLVLILFPSLVPAEFTILRRLIPQTMVTLLAGIFVIGLFLFRLNGPDTPFTRFLPDKQLAKSIFSVYIIILMAFLYVFPTADQFRLERRTLQTMAQFIKSEKVSPKNVYFYDKSFVNGVLYLNQPYEISILRTPEDLEKVIATKADQRVFIISQNRYFDRLPEKILKHLPKVVQEPAFPWDRKSSIRKNYVMRTIKLDLKKAN